MRLSVGETQEFLNWRYTFFGRHGLRINRNKCYALATSTVTNKKEPVYSYYTILVWHNYILLT